MTRFRSLVLLVSLLSIGPLQLLAEDPPEVQYRKLLQAYDQEGGSRTFAKKFVHFAEQNPEAEVSVDALLWSIRRVKGSADAIKALKLRNEHHWRRKSLAKGCEVIAAGRSVEAETLLRKLFEKSPHREVQAAAGFHPIF